MRAGGEGTTPYPLLSAESFRNVLLSESVIAAVETPMSLRRRAYIIRYKAVLTIIKNKVAHGFHIMMIVRTHFFVTDWTMANTRQ